MPATQTVTYTITGPAIMAALIDPDTHTSRWAEAWQIRARGGPPVAADELQQRTYLVRVVHEGRHAVGFAVIDDLIARDVAAAGLPAELAFMAQTIAVLPAGFDEDRARWVMRYLARQAVRGLPIPPYGGDQLMAWRAAVDTLADVASHDVADDHGF